LSYYTVFSLAPLLVIVLSIAGLVFGDEAVRGEVFGQIAGLMGAEAAKGIQDMLASVSKPSTGVIGTAAGAVILLIGATTVFGELQDAMDRIWRAPVRKKTSGLWSLLRARLLSFGMVLGVASCCSSLWSSVQPSPRWANGGAAGSRAGKCCFRSSTPPSVLD
jgi:membrane protein